jgi:hypothetical protein
MEVYIGNHTGTLAETVNVEIERNDNGRPTFLMPTTYDNRATHYIVELMEVAYEEEPRFAAEVDQILRDHERDAADEFNYFNKASDHRQFSMVDFAQRVCGVRR